LREITTVGTDFSELRDSTGADGDTRSDGCAIALGSDQLKGNAVVAVPGFIYQQ
jgi:hypothetical protein